MTTSPSRSVATFSRPSCTWCRSLRSVSPASRSSSVSPTQRIGFRPASSAARTLSARARSDSAKCSRRSEWPSTTPCTSSSTSIGAETSPVNAPFGAWCMFCAYTSTREPRVESTTACRSVNGTQTPTSTPSAVETRGSSEATNASASATVLCIFQLPAISGVRAIYDRTSTAGSVLPSMSSSDAPPPVERWVTRSARPNSVSAAAESPPPTTVVPGASATASATARVPAANGSSSNAPIGPFQNTLAALRVGSEAIPEHEVERKAQLGVAGVEQPARRIEVLLRTQRVADRVPLHGQEREGHRAADEDRVRPLEERLQHADLVRHLRAADDGHERAGRILEDPGERLDLALQQQAGRTRQQAGDALGRRVRAMRRAERVVDIGVGERGQPLGQLGVVLRLARLEADVLEHHDVAVGHVIEVLCKRHLGAQQLAEPLGYRAQRELRVASLRAAEVRDEQ